MTYIDGFVLPVKKADLKAYKEMANYAGKIWKKHGALDFKECMGDDLNPEMGKQKIALFPDIAKAKSGETVMFSYIVYKNRKHRDAVNKKVMAEMEHESDKFKDMPIPFDVKRMAYGGFRTIVDL